MAKIALQHPADDVRGLIEHVLGRLGHVLLKGDAEHEAHILVLEPASQPDLEAALGLRALRPELPIVCVSVSPPFPAALALEPAAYIVKPFTVAGLRATIEDVLDAGLRQRRGLRAY